MFACSLYPANAEFLDNVRHEANDNVKRLRNHPKIVIWAGNNEVETAW
ncbi:MAG: glycoside hydrolase family 2 TIM barrel-domain containing protein, partial [Pyrinomonadaceae bacterium]